MVLKYMKKYILYYIILEYTYTTIGFEWLHGKIFLGQGGTDLSS